MRVVEFQETPNPAALKIILDRPAPAIASPAMRSYSVLTKADPAVDPLGARIGAVPGVKAVLIVKDWVTVTKDSDAAWPAVKRGVKDAIESTP